MATAEPFSPHDTRRGLWACAPSVQDRRGARWKTSSQEFRRLRCLRRGARACTVHPGSELVTVSAAEGRELLERRIEAAAPGFARPAAGMRPTSPLRLLCAEDLPGANGSEGSRMLMYATPCEEDLDWSLGQQIQCLSTEIDRLKRRESVITCSM